MFTIKRLLEFYGTRSSSVMFRNAFFFCKQNTYKYNSENRPQHNLFSYKVLVHLPVSFGKKEFDIRNLTNVLCMFLLRIIEICFKQQMVLTYFVS